MTIACVLPIAAAAVLAINEGIAKHIGINALGCSLPRLHEFVAWRLVNWDAPIPSLARHDRTHCRYSNRWE